MPFDIIHDAEKGIAALIDPQNGRALGPIALGEDAVKVLESFAGIHGVDPATIPGHTLESRWEKFVTDITDIVDEVEGGASELEGKPAAGDAGGADPGKSAGEKAPPTQAELDAAAAAENAAQPHPPAPAPHDNDPSAQAEARPIPAVPGQGQVLCPVCDGFRTIVDHAGNEVECPECHGAGVIAAPAPAAGGGAPTA